MASCKKWLCLSLAALMLAGSAALFAGCAESGENTTETQSTSDSIALESGESEEDHRFDDVNYGGEKPFRIYTSTNVASTGMGNSNFLIEGSGQTEGSAVNDAVLERNIAVEEMLGIKLEFTQVDVDYNGVVTDIRKYSTSGLDEFDLVINDLFPFANLSIEGQFCNTLDNRCVFDFDRSYWYGDYMADLSLVDGYQNILAGDFFIDVIRSAHLLLLNKEIYMDNYQKEADELYNTVLNYEWTFDKMNEIISGIYADTNSSGQKDTGDTFGFITCEYWGGSIAYTISGNPTFVDRKDSDGPAIVLSQGERSNELAAAMSRIFNNDCSSVSKTSEPDLLDAFVNNECLILDYQRLGSLENEIMRNMEGDACVLPYPMLYAADKKYTTSAHDTTEVGAILTTSYNNLEYISTVVEVLNRETAKIVMPKYYKEGLQIQYVDDSKGAQMIDIIHDNFDNSFALAYNNALGSVMLNYFSNAMEQGREFAAMYTSKMDAKLTRDLRSKVVAKYIKNNHIED